MSINGVNNSNNTYFNTSKTSGTAKSNNSAGFSNALNSAINSKTNLDQIFEEASQKYNVSVDLLKAVAKTESNFNTNAVSSAGAQGIMQLMPSTAKGLGVTDSFDARQNIMGGAKLLSGLLNKYNGNTELALAAYNAGSGSVDKYGGIPPFKETQNYVKKVMGNLSENYSAGATSTVDSSDNSSDYADYIQQAINLNFYNKVLNSDSINDSNSDNSNDTISTDDLQDLINMEITYNFFGDSPNEIEEVLFMNALQSQLQRNLAVNSDIQDQIDKAI